MLKLLIDTDVLIDFSKGKSELLKKLLNLSVESKAMLYTTPVNVAEFLNDVFLLKHKDRMLSALEYLGNFKIQPIDKKGGILAGQYLREGGIEFMADALIGGSCVAGGLKLVTRNRKHFNKIKDLEIYQDKAVN